MSNRIVSEDESEEDRRGSGRRQEELPVSDDRRNDNRRTVPGLSDLFDHLRRGDLNIGPAEK